LKALSFSKVGKVILEEIVVKTGYQIAGDGFIRDGQLMFRCFAQEHFSQHGNPFVPVGESFPLQLPNDIQDKIHNEIQRLLTLLEMQIGALNFDVMLSEQQKIYLMEIGPRGGGNLISEVIKHVTGIDLAKYIVDTALNLDIENRCLIPDKTTKFCSSYMLHAQINGYFQGIELCPSIQKNILEIKIFISNGDQVHAFDGSNHTLGYILLKFNTAEEMLEKMDSMNTRVFVKISK